MSRMIATDASFDEAERTALRHLAALMIPPEGELPSADDPAIFAEVLDRLALRADVVREGLARLASNCPGIHSLPLAEQHAAITRLRADQRAFVALFESAVAACYYRDDRVLTSLGLPPRAPYPEGNVVDPTDWSLLDPVRKRAPFFRDI
jgi:hypothetical protein